MPTTPLAAWLTDLGLEQFTSLFEENQVDLATLAVLTDGDLKELGLPFGPRKRILAAIGATGHAAMPTAAVDGLSERRQLTVLFCDMVGFTELANRVDPEVLRNVIRVYEDACAVCITRYDGYLFQRLGDGIVAFFGFPHAHEGEADRCVRAGLEILESLAELEVPEVGRIKARIGVATGVVVVSAAERSAVGETMNLAARLQAIAEVGTMVVSERVHQLAGGAFEYLDLGEQNLKGIERPTRAYQVRGVSTAATRFEAAHGENMVPLVGREPEIRLLLDRWQQARSGTGQVVLLSGEAGIGKSRIVNALRERLEATGARPMRFQCSPYYMNSAFYPPVAYFERTLRFTRDEPAASKLDKLEAMLYGRLGRPLSDVQLVATMMSIPCIDRYGPLPVNPRQFKEETTRALVDLTEAAARQQASVVLFEDVHWVDPTTLEVLDRMIERAKSMPILVLITARPEFTPRWSAPHVTALTLGKLDRDQSMALISRVTGGKPLPAGLTEQILEKTDGVPLFVEELTKTLLESGGLLEGDDEYEYADGPAGFTIPATLRDSLMARLDRVPGVREIAQIGAAIGREFSYDLLSAVTPIPDEELEAGLAQLTDSGLAFRRGSMPNATYVFKHALVQDTAYESLLKSTRQNLHGEIARVLADRFPETVATEPELLAQHFSAGALHVESIPYWKRAGELALQRFAVSEAISHLRKALAAAEHLPEGPGRNLTELGIRTLLGPAIVGARGWAAPEVSDVLQPALALARSLEHRESYLPVLHGLWVNMLTSGRLQESLEWATELLSTTSEEDDLEIAGHRAAMTSHYWLGNLVSAREHGDKIRRMYDSERHQHIVSLTNSDPLTADGIYRCQYLWMLGYPDQAIAVSRDNHAHARRRKHPFDHAFAMTLGAQVYDFCHEPERLLEHAREGEEVGREHGLQIMSEVLAEISKGIAKLRMRDEGSAAHLKEAADRLSRSGQRIWGPYVRALRGEALAQVGDTAAGLVVIDEVLAEIEARDERVHLAEVLRIRGSMLLQQGEATSGEQVLEEAIAFAQHQESRSWELRATTTLARHLAAAGRRAEALDRLEPIYGWFTEGFTTHDLLEAKALLDELVA